MPSVHLFPQSAAFSPSVSPVCRLHSICFPGLMPSVHLFPQSAAFTPSVSPVCRLHSICFPSLPPSLHLFPQSDAFSSPDSPHMPPSPSVPPPTHPGRGAYGGLRSVVVRHHHGRVVPHVALHLLNGQLLDGHQSTAPHPDPLGDIADVGVLCG